MLWSEMNSNRHLHREVVAQMMSLWQSVAKAVGDSERTVMHYLFTLNTGGLAGTVTLIAARGPSWPIDIAALSFAVGVLVVLLRAARTYYLAKGHLKECQRIQHSFLDDQTSYEEILTSGEELSKGSRELECLAWLSAVAFVVGLVTAGWAICASVQPTGSPQ